MRDKGQELEKALIGKKKILVIGPNASGKSTLSKTLGERFSLDVCHLDRLYWSENWKAVDNDLFIDRVSQVLQSPKTCIIDGDYIFNLESRLKYADLVILITMPTLTCLKNLINRWIKNKNKSRDDMAEGCHERLSASFIWYLIHYQSRSGKLTHQLLTQKYCGEIVKIDGIREMRECQRSLCR